VKREFFLKQVKRNKLSGFLPFFISVLILSSCGGNKMSEDIASRIYVENIIAEEKYAAQPDSIKIYHLKIFEKYNVTREDYNRFIKNLTYDIEKWNSFFSKADRYLIELKADRVID